MKDPGNDGRPTVQIGMSECPQEEAKRFVLGPELTSPGEIDKQVDPCVKIEQNSISTPEAINLFNDMIDTVANKRGEIEEQEGKGEL